MRPLKEMPLTLVKSIRFILCDIDDTLTVEGTLPAETFTMLHRLKESGFYVIPVTGRPAGWCDHIARFWPVDGIVGENGAFYFRYDPASKKMLRHYFKDEASRHKDRDRLNAILEQILTDIPGSALSADQAYREADLAIDFCEDVPELPIEAVKKIKEIFVQSGATAKISSIHVNAWFGDYSKLEMTRVFTKEIFDTDLDRHKDEFVFCGDSPNDEPLFQYFPNSCGVANVKDFESEMTYLPRYVARSKGGKGFVEICKKFLDFD